MLCCANCFGDSFLYKHISRNSLKTGECDICSTSNTQLINPDSLRDYFQPIVSIYSENNSVVAKQLVNWFQDDWQIFSSLDYPKAQSLLGEILGNSDFIGKLYYPRYSPDVPPVKKWADFRDEIMCENRFFYNHELDLDRLKELFDYLITNESIVSGELFRARIQKDHIQFLLEEMGKPPANEAKNGRANPVGIPYLYLASNPKTAIAETRPHPGDFLSVAKFLVINQMQLLNLINPRKSVSPFNVQEDDLSILRYDLDFLCLLDNELAKPILPRVAALEYLPTQFISEFIKKCGYDGVVFKSSISDGVNVTLFDDSKVIAVELMQYEVTVLHYDQRQI